MKKGIILSLFLILTFIRAKAQEKEMIQLVDSLFGKVASGTELSIALMDGNRQTMFGLRMEESGWVPVENEEHIFEIGSVSKVFTSMLLAKDLAAGTLKANQKVSSILKWKLKDKPAITLLQLSNHTSGLPRLPGNIITSMASNPADPYKGYNENMLKTYLTQELKLEHLPGETFSYSNLGAGLLGLVLAKKHKCTFEQLLQDSIFKPLGMMHSSTGDPEGIKVEGLDAQGQVTSSWHFDVLAGAGAIRSSVSDMTRFVRYCWDTTQTVNRLMQTVTTRNEGTMQTGLGWMLILGDKPYPYVWHNGATGGFRSSVILDPHTHKAVIVLSNFSHLHEKHREVDQLSFLLFKQINKP